MCLVSWILSNTNRVLSLSYILFVFLIMQGPCVQNQETLSRSRLLDAVSGFIQVFAILQRKLYRDTSQMELLRELLALQEEMFILLLSMLEG